MLTRSLCCFKGLSAEAEARLWRRGCLDWRHLKVMSRNLLSASKSTSVLEQLSFFESALDARSADFFINRLPCGHKLRIFPALQTEAAFLDIETTGLGRDAVITVIGALHNGSMKTFVRGRNLPDFIRLWQKTGVLLTFNGTHFDLPFLMRTFGFSHHPPHIDLMTEARHWGFSGGLKVIENKLGCMRTEEEDGTGQQAVELWNQFDTTGDETSLRKLVAYNTRDVQSLHLLARHLWKLSCQNYPAPRPES